MRDECLYRPVQAGKLILPGNVFLAPVAGWTDSVFRSICVDYGANLTFTELVSSEALVRGGVARGTPTEILLRRGEHESRYAIQLFGANPEVMARAAAIIAPYRPVLIDINAGCPVPKVTRTGAGSALMKYPSRLAAVVKAVVEAVRGVPDGADISVKLRSGWDAKSVNFEECAFLAAESGASMVSLHARTCAQGYSGKSSWEHIAKIAASLSIPVCGSGDLRTAEDAKAMLSETGCAAVMFARGAMGNPFVFKATRELLSGRSATDVSPEEKIRVALNHARALSGEIGEERACREMRKVFCAYIKGLNGAASMRDTVVRAVTIEDFCKISRTFLSR